MTEGKGVQNQLRKPSNHQLLSDRRKRSAKTAEKTIKPPTFKRQKEKEYNSAWMRFFVAHTRRRRWHWKLRKSVIFCTVCKEAKKVNGSAKGSRNQFQRSVLVEHQKSASHISAISMTQQQKRIATVVTRVQEKTSSALQDQLKVSTSRSAESQHFKINWKSIVL